MRRNHFLLLAFLVAGVADQTEVLADGTGTIFTYQGQLKDGGAPVNGFVDLEFRLYDAESGGSQVGKAVVHCNLEVVNGLFTVGLDFGEGAFGADPRWLVVGVGNPSIEQECGGKGYVILDPRQKITPAPKASYAYVAPWSGLEGIPEGFADGVDDTGDLTVPFVADHNGAGTTTMTINQHGVGGAGAFNIDNPDNYWEALFASSNSFGTTLRTINSGSGYPAHFQVLNDQSAAAAVFAQTNGTGSALLAIASGNGYGVSASAEGVGNGVQGVVSGTGNAIQGKVIGNDGRAAYFEISSALSPSNAVEIHCNGNGTSQAISAVHTGLGDCGLFTISNPNNPGEAVEARTNGSGDALQAINSGTGRAGFFRTDLSSNTAHTLYSESRGLGRAAYFVVNNSASYAAALDVRTNGTGSAADFRKTSTSSTNNVVNIQQSGLGRAVLIQILNDQSTATAVQIFNAGTGLSLDVTGKVKVDVLEIAGGSDLSENFDVNGKDVTPGMVVVIDPATPGKLKISTTPYDHKVAGIVSGAGGVRTGMLMGQKGSLADGAQPIALTGRVYGLADATSAPIEPGDLLTTSSVAGHVMKVTDPTRAQGAIIGKAMTPLKEGTGLVLILVNLQ